MLINSTIDLLIKGFTVLKRVSPFCACVLAALCSTSAAAAERSASVTFELLNIGYQLIDLNPGDGIAPSFQINSDLLTVRADLSEWYEPPLVEQIDHFGTVDLSAPFGSASSTRTATSAKVTAHIGGSPYAQAAGGYSENRLTFTLSPFTALVLNATASVTGSATDETALWFGNAYIEGYLSSGNYHSNMHDQGFTGNKNSVFYLSGYLNSADEAATGWLRFSGGADTYLPAPPVPEPESYAMLLAGLGVIGALARRRRRPAACAA